MHTTREELDSSIHDNQETKTVCWIEEKHSDLIGITSHEDTNVRQQKKKQTRTNSSQRWKEQMTQNTSARQSQQSLLQWVPPGGKKVLSHL